MQFTNRARVALITAGVMLAVPVAGDAAPHNGSAHKATKRAAHTLPHKRAAHAAPHKRSTHAAPHRRSAHSAPRRAAHRAPKLSSDYAAWSRVATCEEGGWVVAGYNYPDSLGINRTNYERFGGTPMSPGPVTLAERETEIRVADRLVAYYRAAIPDQGGCAAW
jgi:hypothetical protein